MPKTVKIGMIGTSWWVDLLYLPSLKSHPDAEVVAICGRHREPAEALAESYGIGSVYSDYRDLLAHEGLDGVMIVTPDDTHARMALDAVDAGLHVLCEKPLANNVALARQMYERATEAGVKHMVMFTWRFQPYMRYLKRLIDDGYIGHCHQMVAEFVGGWGLEPTYHWRLDGARANGVCGDLGPHMVDLYRYFVGEVTSVSGDFLQVVDRSAFDGPRASPSNDCGIIGVRSADGARGSINVSAVSPSGDRMMVLGVTLFGDKGTLEARQIFDGKEKKVELRGITDGDTEFQALEVPEDLLGGLAVDDLLGVYSHQSAGPRRFIDAIGNDADIPMTFLDGLKAQEVVDAALQSDRERRWIDVD